MATMQTLALPGLEGQVLRLEGVVDRFGSYQQQGRSHRTLCIRGLRVAGTGQPLEPDHWWFRLRADWCEAGVQPGDTVLFTAKVRHCSKGHHDPEDAQGRPLRQRERVLGLAGRVRDLVVLRRGPAENLLLAQLQEELRRRTLLQEEAEAEARQLALHRDALLCDLQRLRTQLTTWKARCDGPRVDRSRRGFQRLDRLAPSHRR
jgi:hypothetical protein